MLITEKFSSFRDIFCLESMKMCKRQSFKCQTICLTLETKPDHIMLLQAIVGKDSVRSYPCYTLKTSNLSATYSQPSVRFMALPQICCWCVHTNNDFQQCIGITKENLFAAPNDTVTHQPIKCFISPCKRMRSPTTLTSVNTMAALQGCALANTAAANTFSCVAGFVFLSFFTLAYI